MKDLIWILSDNNPGSINQSISIAEELNIKYKIINIQYNFLINLPNIFFTFYPFYIPNKIILKLKQEILKDKPNIIISSGRRIAPIAVFLKRIAKNNISIIQIMNPEFNSKNFAIIILPKHDKSINAENTFRITGSLHNIKSRLLAQKNQLLNQDPQYHIAVLIGGNTKNFKYHDSDLYELINSLKKITINNKLPLYFSFSQRTPNNIKELIYKHFSTTHIIYDPIFTKNNRDLYSRILFLAKFIIVFVDSVSMCSESVSTGKPVYIFIPSRFYSKKHISFINALHNQRMIKIMQKNINHLTNYSYIPLDEMKKVILKMKKLIK